MLDDTFVTRKRPLPQAAEKRDDAMLIRRCQKGIRFYVVSLLICSTLLSIFIRDAHSLTAEEEKKMGRQVLLEIQKEADFMKDLTIQTFIEKLGYSIVDQVGPTPFEFKFYVIDALDPNAFAIPGGYIFVTTGLLVLAENEQEIAGVLSHEIAHVTQRHVAQMIEKSKRLNIATLAAVIAAMLAGRGGTGSQAGVAMATATAGALQLKYTREMETDADQNGLTYLVKAGYDPNGLISFLNRIQRVSLAIAPTVPAYLLTHPATESRISLMENLLQTGRKPVGPFRTVPNFSKIRAMAFVEEREPQVGVTHFQSLIDARSDAWEGYYGLGLAYRKMGRYDKSTEAFQKAHSIASRDLDISRELGITYFFWGKTDQAIESLEAIGDANSDLMVLYYLGRSYQEKGDFARALPLLLRVQKEEPEFTDIYYHLGSVYGRTGQKGLSHFYFGKHFKFKRERNNALLHYRAAVDGLERGSPEREEALREIKELTSPQR